MIVSMAIMRYLTCVFMSRVRTILCAQYTVGFFLAWLANVDQMLNDGQSIQTGLTGFSRGMHCC